MNHYDSYFEKIFRTNYQSIHTFLLKKLGSADDAADATQETFYRAARSNVMSSTSSPKSYLYKIAHNIAIDQLRTRAFRARHLEVADMEAQPSPEPLPDQAVEHQERQARMQKALDSLPARCREVFILHRYENLTYREIASGLGISQKTVEKHISTAIYRLQKAFFQS